MSGAVGDDTPRVVLRGVGIATIDEVPRDLEDRFPGRWNRKRAMWEIARPAAFAVGSALEEAGAWRPGGDGRSVEGGHLVAADLHALGPSVRFAAQLRDAARSGRPVQRASEFLFSLPSTVAALAGLAFGLERFQSTVHKHGMSAMSALRLAVDLIRARRLDRIVVTALTAADADGGSVLGGSGLALRGDDRLERSHALAVSWCLEVDDPRTAPDVAEPCVIECAITPTVPSPPRPTAPAATTAELLHAAGARERVATLPAALRGLAAPSLLAATVLARPALGGPQFDADTCTLVHDDAWSGTTCHLRLALPAGRTRPLSSD